MKQNRENLGRKILFIYETAVSIVVTSICTPFDRAVRGNMEPPKGKAQSICNQILVC